MKHSGLRAGAERATYLTLKLLAQQGFKITVVTEIDNPAVIPGIKHHITRYLQSSNRLTRWTLARLLAASRVFIKLLKEHDVLYIPLASYSLIPIAKKAEGIIYLSTPNKISPFSNNP